MAVQPTSKESFSDLYGTLYGAIHKKPKAKATVTVKQIVGRDDVILVNGILYHKMSEAEKDAWVSKTKREISASKEKKAKPAKKKTSSKKPAKPKKGAAKGRKSSAKKSSSKKSSKKSSSKKKSSKKKSSSKSTKGETYSALAQDRAAALKKYLMEE